MSILSLFFGIALASTPCPATPYGSVQDSNLHICHKGYYTDYDIQKHIPVFVSWNLTKEMTISCNTRNGSFTRDPDANGNDVASSEYNSSGYDRGHMANAADFLSDTQEEHESFYMTNILPQNPTNNRGGWKWLETESRGWANDYGDAQIYAGGIVTTNKKMKDVSIPDMLWKVVFIPSQNKAIAVYLPNNPIAGSDILNYQISVSDLEKHLGEAIPLPISYNKNSIDHLEAVDFGSMIDKKHNSCNITSHVK